MEYLKGRIFKFYDKETAYEIVDQALWEKFCRHRKLNLVHLPENNIEEMTTFGDESERIKDGLKTTIKVIKTYTYRVLDVLILPVSVALKGSNYGSREASAKVEMLAENVETGKLERFDLKDIKLEPIGDK